MRSRFDTLVDWANIISAALAIAALAIALGFGWSRFQLLILRRRRWTTIGRALHDIGFRFTRRHFRRHTDGLLRRRALTGQSSVAQELTWLSELIGQQAREVPSEICTTVNTAFAFIPAVVQDYQNVNLAMAEGYQRYAAGLRLRWFLRSAAGPFVADEYIRARATAELLLHNSRHQILIEEVSDPDSPESVLKEWHSLNTLDSFHERVRLLSWPNMALVRSLPAYAAVRTSYTPFRLARPDTPGSRSAPEGMQVHLVPYAAGEGLHTSHEFDGVMTRLHGRNGFRVEMDQHSGRQTLHLSVSETSFFAFAATAWAERAPERHGPEARRARLLSVNLILIDESGKALLVQRNQGITHGGRYAGAVSGACEVVSRQGIPADLDADGFPDLMRTVRREALEELGLDISGRSWHLGCIGLIEVDSPRDLGTFVLTATARLPSKVESFRVMRGSTDDVEGTWELGGSSLVIDLPRATSSRRDLFHFIRWMRASPALLPHGVGGILLLILGRLQATERSAQSTGARLGDLYDALREEALPEYAQQQPTTAWEQALFA